MHAVRTVLHLGGAEKVHIQLPQNQFSKRLGDQIAYISVISAATNDGIFAWSNPVHEK
jgi:hypothetical protein